MAHTHIRKPRSNRNINHHAREFRKISGTGLFLLHALSHQACREKPSTFTEIKFLWHAVLYSIAPLCAYPALVLPWCPGQASLIYVRPRRAPVLQPSRPTRPHLLRTCTCFYLLLPAERFSFVWSYGFLGFLIWTRPSVTYISRCQRIFLARGAVFSKKTEPAIVCGCTPAMYNRIQMKEEEINQSAHPL